MTAGYGGGDILKDVSFTVAEREIMCIVGPNGAGKSTLLATISGVLRPRRGAIAFQGESLVGLAPRDVLAKGVVLVPQAHSLFPEMTVRENVEMGAYTVRDAESCAAGSARWRSCSRSYATGHATRPGACPAASSAWSSSRAA